jgi:hypothetical protein
MVQARSRIALMDQLSIIITDCPTVGHFPIESTEGIGIERMEAMKSPDELIH